MIRVCTACGRELAPRESCCGDEAITNNGAACDLCAELGIAQSAVADVRTPSGMWANVCTGHLYRLRSERSPSLFVDVAMTAAKLGGAEKAENLITARLELAKRPS